MKHTRLHGRHTTLGARMADFAGWDMPIQYPKGIVFEHLATRKTAGLFDVSHMGRFRVKGERAIDFLQRFLTNNVLNLSPGNSHYTILANPQGGAIDDAYLYQLDVSDYVLVVNASNAQKDVEYLHSQVSAFTGVTLEDISESMAMIALQGPQSEAILENLLEAGALPPKRRNALNRATLCGAHAIVARTGYTGEPICFEVFIAAEAVEALWDALLDGGAEPVGLGARDTLRLEAGLPLYGHEFGIGPEGAEIAALACPVAQYAVSFDENKGNYVGKEALLRQAEARKRYAAGDFSQMRDLPWVIRPFRLIDNGIARAKTVVYDTDKPVGYVTSGTMAPYWVPVRDSQRWRLTDEQGRRAVGLALIRPDIPTDAVLEADVRQRRLKMRLVRRNLDNRSGDIALPVVE